MTLSQRLEKALPGAFLSKGQLNQVWYEGHYRSAELIGKDKVAIFPVLHPEQIATFLYGVFDESALPDEFFTDCLELESELKPLVIINL